MLRIRTPNSELACLEDFWCDIHNGDIQAIARAKDFESDVIIHRQYMAKNNKDYLLYFFSNTNLRDGQIYDLRDMELDDRIGLLAPVSAFSSREHTRSQDEYFEAVASSAFWELLLDSNNNSLEVELSSDDEFEISDFYSDHIAVLIIRKITHQTFNIQKYIPGLFAFGYALHRPGYKINSSWKFDGLPKGKELKIRPVNTDFLGNGYLETLYTEMLPYEQNPLAGFLLQYQIFEMLMHSVFNDRLAQFKSDINAFSGTASDLREVFESLQKVSAERERIRVAIERSQPNSLALHDIVTTCKELLISAHKTPKSDNFSDLLYDVRNLIFHNYRAIPNGSHSTIDQVNKELMRVMPTLLARP